jgi:hypothetical protein
MVLLAVTHRIRSMRGLARSADVEFACDAPGSLEGTHVIGDTVA